MTGAVVEDFLARYAGAPAGGIGDDVQTAWQEDGTPDHQMRNQPLRRRDIPALHRLRKAVAPTLVRQPVGAMSRHDIVVVLSRGTATAAARFAWRRIDRSRVHGSATIEETIYPDAARLRAARRDAEPEPMLRLPAAARVPL